MLPRLLRLHPSTSQRLVRLSKEAEKDGAYRVAKRLRAVVLNSQGHTSGELANLLQAPRSKVSAWLQRYQSEGIEGLFPRTTGSQIPPPRSNPDSGQRFLPQTRRRLGVVQVQPRMAGSASATTLLAGVEPHRKAVAAHPQERNP